MKILVIDIGGTSVKALASGEPEWRRVRSGPDSTPAMVVKAVEQLTSDWAFDAISIGFPGVVVHDRIVAEPRNLGGGWVGFDFERAFGRPVKLVNDAALQALGSYEGGRMLFLGLGTGLGSALIVEGNLQPLELAHLPYRKGRTFEDYVGVAALARLGRRRWRRHVVTVVGLLSAALQPDYVVIGGGNARKLDQVPEGARLGANEKAFAGGLRLWEDASPASLSGHGRRCRPELWLVRHGETAWSAEGRHTGRSDVALTPRGESQGERLRARLEDHPFALVLTSPLRRARDTCRLAGRDGHAVVDDDLSEWNYGDCEGRTTGEIQREDPKWSLWSSGVQGGETVEAVGARADRIIARSAGASGDVAIFGHGHALRVLAARWLGLPAAAGGSFSLFTAAVSVLGYEGDRPALALWNDVSHLQQTT